MTPPAAQTAEKHIRSYLDVARTKWLLVRFFEGSLRVLAATAILVLVSFLADNAFTLPSYVRLGLLVATFAVFFGGLFLEIFYFAKRSPSDESMARIIEKKNPGFDNSIINSVQLAKTSQDASGAMIVSTLVNNTAKTVDKSILKGLVSFKKIRTFAITAVLGCILLVGYGFALPNYFGNAFERFVMPLSYVAPITDTQLSVEPGDLTIGYGRPVTVIGHVSGVLPSEAVIYFRPRKEGKYISQEMEFNGKEFSHVFSSVTEDIEYYVEAGDAKSPVYIIETVIVPAISHFSLDLVFPDYTFLGSRSIPNANGSIIVPKGTKVTLSAETNVRLGKVSINFSGEKTLSVPPEGKNFKTTFTVTKEGWYQINLKDIDGVSNENPAKFPITIVKDKSPQIIIIRPHGEITTSPEREVIIGFQASDDFGLSYIEVCYHLNSGDEKIADKWEIKPGTKVVVDQHIWKMAQFAFKPGDVVSWYLRIKDSGDNPPIMSPVMDILIVSEDELRSRLSNLLEDAQAQIAALLRMQKDARRESEEIRTLLDAKEDADFAKQCETLEGKQDAVRLRCKTIVDGMTDPVFEMLLIKPALQKLKSGLMITAMEQISELKGAAFGESRSENLGKVEVTQDAIIRELERLLERMPSIINQLKEGKSAEEIAEDFPEKKMEWYKQKLEEFIQEQRKVIEMTRELERIPSEDWTEREEAMQKELEAIEEKWQKFFEEHRDDFSKLPFQDFSDGRQVDEFVEIYQAVTVAYEAIKEHGHEIAVPLEQAGAERAEELVHNIEAWLPDTPDRDKWSMEEPLTQDEMPMAELPEELEDIVGDLIEEEEDMADDVEDVTSSWSDSLDEGAGWDCLDGPISNMSAKGKTGNRMPNKSEIGGRSGEGRSGKSSGQFVEKNATGKGGRETPTRLTKDPFESGEVNDTSKDPISGSTGGGKVSGQGAQGLDGPPPPEVEKEMGRLAGQQADLMAKAQGLLHELRKRRFPTKDVERAIEEIKDIEKQLKEGAHGDLSARIRAVVQKLRDAEKAIGEQVKINRERRRNVPERDRDGINGATDEGVPPDYKELVEDYYKALAEEEGGKKDE